MVKRTARKLIMEDVIADKLYTLEEMCNIDIECLDTMVPVYKNGKNNSSKSKLYEISGQALFVKAIKGECSYDELKTIHNQDSIVNDVIRMITSETTSYLSNIDKNIINRRLFTRGSPVEISSETTRKMTKLTQREYKTFMECLENGEFRDKNNPIIYYNAAGEKKSSADLKVTWVLVPKDYKLGDDWFGVSAYEKKYFDEHGKFPLIGDDQNSKLGKKWFYLAFELAWMCSGQRYGLCQCPDVCYAKHMETTYKNVRDRVMKRMNAWATHTTQEKIDFFYKKIMYDRNGMRFCDTGDVPDQETLEEIFEIVNGIVKKMKNKGMSDKDIDGRFYIYSARYDLDWSNKPYWLVLNASNEKLYRKVEDANWFRAIESFEMIEKEYEDLPEEYDIETLHICNCNCKCCDYCSICRGQIVWEIIG